MKMITLSMCISLMWGCARPQPITPVQVMLPNGSTGAVVFCGKKSECFRMSTDVCHTGYTILQKDDVSANDFASSQQESEYIIQCFADKEK